jgi:hypothetical protein
VHADQHKSGQHHYTLLCTRVLQIATVKNGRAVPFARVLQLVIVKRGAMLCPFARVLQTAAVKNGRAVPFARVLQTATVKNGQGDRRHKAIDGHKAIGARERER